MEKPIGTSTLFFGAIIVLLTYASVAPQFQAGEACTAPLKKPINTRTMRRLGLHIVCACSMGLKGTSGKRAIGLAQICKCPGDTALKGLLLHWWHLHTVCALLTKALLLWQAEKPDARTFGPFTPFRERWVGRVATGWGLQGLLIVELLKGNNPVF